MLEQTMARMSKIVKLMTVLCWNQLRWRYWLRALLLRRRKERLVRCEGYLFPFGLKNEKINIVKYLSSGASSGW